MDSVYQQKNNLEDAFFLGRAHQDRWPDFEDVTADLQGAYGPASRAMMRIIMAQGSYSATERIDIEKKSKAPFPVAIVSGPTPGADIFALKEMIFRAQGRGADLRRINPNAPLGTLSLDVQGFDTAEERDAYLDGVMSCLPDLSAQPEDEEIDVEF